MALSHEKYSWRTRDRLLKVTGMDGKTLDQNLATLISHGAVGPSISKRQEIIYGLADRV